MTGEQQGKTVTLTSALSSPFSFLPHSSLPCFHFPSTSVLPSPAQGTAPVPMSLHLVSCSESCWISLKIPKRLRAGDLFSRQLAHFINSPKTASYCSHLCPSFFPPLSPGLFLSGCRCLVFAGASSLKNVCCKVTIHCYTEPFP